MAFRATTAILRRRVVTLFIAGGTLVFIALWLIENATGIIAPIDRYSYPIVILFLSINLLLMALLPRSQAAVEVACYFGVALYLLMHILVFVLAGGGSSLYAVANTLLWMPVIHVAAFVFFSLRRAILAAGSTFLLSAVILCSAMILTGPVALSPEVRVLFMNALCAQLLVLLCLSLVTALRRQVEQATRLARVMESAANTDSLTGIANRRGLERLLGAGADAPEPPLTLILFDIDHFKSINDRFGHLAGDDVLLATARRIDSVLGAGDRVARWGGEEFLVITSGDSTSAARTLADRIRQSVSAVTHPLAGRVTLSAGIAIWSGEEPIVEAFRAADMALSAAKARGRDRVESGD